MEIKPYLRRPQFYETDGMSIIWHGNYVRWMEEARTDFMDQLGFPYSRAVEAGIDFALTDISCKYRAMTRFGEELAITVFIRRLSPAKLELGYEMREASTGELSGVLNTVLFCPEDLYLIREGAATRRRFLDGCICQLRPKYAEALAEYRRLYEHKVRILRDWEEHPSLLDTLDEFNLRMAQTGALLIHYRAHFVKRLREVTPPIHLDFSGGREKLGLAYETVSTVTDPEDSPRSILPQLLAHQESHRKAELESRQCLSGPHKDDLTVELNGMSAKTVASQGQTRTAALSLKLASREIFYQETGEWPVLLLDDVLSELDARRQEFVLRRINGGQVFITCCEDARLEGLEEGKVFHIHGGALKP